MAACFNDFWTIYDSWTTTQLGGIPDRRLLLLQGYETTTNATVRMHNEEHWDFCIYCQLSTVTTSDWAGFFTSAWSDWRIAQHALKQNVHWNVWPGSIGFFVCAANVEMRAAFCRITVCSNGTSFPPLFVLVLARLVWLFTTLLQLKTRISGPLMKLEDSTLVSKISPFFPTFVGWHGLDTSYGDQIWNQQNHSHLSAFLVGTVIFMDKSKCRSGPWKRMWSFLAFGWLVDLGNGRSNGPLSALT